MDSSISVSSSPKNIEIIAGGASFAPRRWSFPAEATDILKRSWYSFTPLMTAQRNMRNCAFSRGVLPGSNRFTPSEVCTDQLSCLPEPLIPSNGFSWSMHLKP